MPTTPAKPRTPQPYTLTEDLAQRIIQHVEEGQYASVAAQLEGVPQRTWEHWMQWARAELAEYPADLDAVPGSLAALADNVKTAKARNIAKRVTRINTAGEKAHLWPAEMTMLERTSPELYGRRTDVRVESRSVVLNVTAQLSEALALKLLQVSAQEGKLLPEGDVPTEATDSE